MHRLGPTCLVFLVALGGCSHDSPVATSVALPSAATAGNESARTSSKGGAQDALAPAASPTPTPIAVGIGSPGTPGSCTSGYGAPDATCTKQDPKLLADLEITLDTLLATHPQLFDINSEVGPGGYKVLDQLALEAAVVGGMTARGYCAEVHGGELQVKNSEQFSETYTLLRPSGHLARASGYHGTCTPAAFPLNPTDVIARVRVAFYEMRCGKEVTEPPRFNAIYTGCRGTLTASPKDKNDDDVPAYIHGPAIQWEVESGQQAIMLEDYPGTDFNMFVTGTERGEFRICATVQLVRSCMNGQIY